MEPWSISKISTITSMGIDNIKSLTYLRFKCRGNCIVGNWKDWNSSASPICNNFNIFLLFLKEDTVKSRRLKNRHFRMYLLPKVKSLGAVALRYIWWMRWMIDRCSSHCPCIVSEKLLPYTYLEVCVNMHPSIKELLLLYIQRLFIGLYCASISITLYYSFDRRKFSMIKLHWW